MTEPAPDWLTDLLAEHRDCIRTCAVRPSAAAFEVAWTCGGVTPIEQDDGNLAKAHRAHVAAVVWAEITERVGGRFTRNGQDVVLDALGGSHE